ncbi:membrane protein insertase YidC [Sediminibacillus albus]|uniref:Membrane protein insertase YidC n=1 Tax=Sediminibacillus albus TaxID=407036 RepID=A0A1G8VL71_9BACI|nr:membrane protein insertase YidC [Sediminibacillus albus]SDJ65930.1 YidC/Oxa1 family membrane protein insertase [Sediminibacillus albus]
MDKHSVFTFFKKYSVIIVILLIFLSGCQGSNHTAASEGWFDHYFVDSFSFLIKVSAKQLNGSYGWSIILITLLIRLILMPLMLKQSKGSYEMKEIMAGLKPEMDELKEKYSDKRDKESQAKLQKEMVLLYQKHQLNPMKSMGCLPMLIQFPILIGFYYAIRSTPEIASHSFLWFNLGHPDIIMPFVAAAIYFLQFKVTQLGMEPQQRKQMAILGFLSPIMIGIISFNSPAALPLYWAVGGLFLILQTLLSKSLYQPKTQGTLSQQVRPADQK